MVDFARALKDTPFPHAVLDHPIDRRTVALAQREMTLLHDDFGHVWQRFRNQHEHKDSLHWAYVPDQYDGIHTIREWMENEQTCVDIAEAFGLPPLTPDGLGGGLHVIPPGGHLGVHVDFNRNADGRYRRVNLLLYVHGQEGCGGDLMLRSAPTGSGVTIGLRPGRLVAFATSESSWHGHPDPYTPPDGLPRMSLACYYYSTEAPEWSQSPHSTVFVG